MFWFTVLGCSQIPILLPVTAAHSLCSEYVTVLLSWVSSAFADKSDNHTTTVDDSRHDMHA